MRVEPLTSHLQTSLNPQTTCDEMCKLIIGGDMSDANLS